jgi:putative hydrolase of the HAD superfamily
MTRRYRPHVALRAVILDLDDTLIVEEEVARASLREAAGTITGVVADAETEEMVLAAVRAVWRSGPYHPLCRELGVASWEGLWATFEGGHPTLEGLRAWIPTFQAQAWSAVLRLFGAEDDALARRASDTYRARQRQGHRLVEGAEALVRSLAGRHRLGLLTNGPADIQRWKLQRIGLADCFDQVVISGETGIGKPDPRAFLLVTERLGVEASDAIMVGDSWERDVVGASRAGMPALWLSRGSVPPEELPGVTPVPDLRHVQQLLDGERSGAVPNGLERPIRWT